MANGDRTEIEYNMVITLTVRGGQNVIHGRFVPILHGDTMRTFLKRLIWPVFLFFFALISGCSSADHISSSPTIRPAEIVTSTIYPSSTPYPTTSLPEPTPTSTFSPPQSNMISTIDKASFVRENYPDNSILKLGEQFVKTFEIKNIGASSWTTSYSLVLDSTIQDDTLNSPAQIIFPHETSPGEIISISISLIAPITPGTYTVYWTVRNEVGEIVPVDSGDKLWAKILVCDPNQACNPPPIGGNASASGISTNLTSFSSDSQGTNASFCMNLPSRNYGPGPASVSLVIDQNNILALGGGSLGPGCFEFQFPISEAEINQAEHVAVSIGHVRILGGPNDPDTSCQSARPNIIAQYPGLDFECHFSMAGYYTNLQVPAGMTSTQADQIITDAVEGAVYGPWILTIK